MSQNNAKKEKSLMSFYHYIILSWIRVNPDKFMEIAKKYKKWAWLNGKVEFVQME